MTTTSLKNFLQQIRLVVNSEVEVFGNIDKIKIFTNLYKSNPENIPSSNDLLSYALEIRKVLQKWSVITEEESNDKKIQGEYCLFITSNCSEFMSLVLCMDDSAIENCLKILSYSLINCQKMGKEPKILVDFFSSTLRMIDSFDKVKEVMEYLSKCACHWLQNFSQFIFHIIELNDRYLNNAMVKIITKCLQCKCLFHFASKSLSNEHLKKIINYILEAILQFSDKIEIQMDVCSTAISDIRKYALLNLAVEYQLRCSRIFDTATRHLHILHKNASECYERIQSLVVSLNEYLSDSGSLHVLDIEQLTKIAVFSYNLCTVIQKELTKKTSIKVNSLIKYDNKVIFDLLVTVRDLILNYRANDPTAPEDISLNIILCYLNFELFTYQNIDNHSRAEEDRRKQKLLALLSFSNCQIPSSLVQLKDLKDFFIRSFVSAIQMEWDLIATSTTTSSTAAGSKGKSSSSSSSSGSPIIVTVCDTKISELIALLLRWNHDHQITTTTTSTTTTSTTTTSTTTTSTTTTSTTAMEQQPKRVIAEVAASNATATVTATDTNSLTIQILLQILLPGLSNLQQQQSLDPSGSEPTSLPAALPSSSSPPPSPSPSRNRSYAFALRILSQAMTALPLLIHTSETTDPTSASRSISTSPMMHLMLSIRNSLSHILQQQQQHHARDYSVEFLKLSESLSSFLLGWQCTWHDCEGEAAATSLLFDLYDLAMSMVSMMATKGVNDGMTSSSALVLISAVNFHTRIKLPLQPPSGGKGDVRGFPDRLYRLLHTLTSCCLRLPLRSSSSSNNPNHTYRSTDSSSAIPDNQSTMEGLVECLVSREARGEGAYSTGLCKEDVSIRWEFLASLCSETIRRNDFSVCQSILYLIESMDPSLTFPECHLSTLCLESQSLWLFGDVLKCATDRERKEGEADHGDDQTRIRIRIIQSLQSIVSGDISLNRQDGGSAAAAATARTSSNQTKCMKEKPVKQSNKKPHSGGSDTVKLHETEAVAVGEADIDQWKHSIVTISCKLRAISLLVQWTMFAPTPSYKPSSSTTNLKLPARSDSSLESLFDLLQSFSASLHQLIELMRDTWEVLRKCSSLTAIPLMLLPSSVIIDSKCVFDAMAISGFFKEQQSLVDALENIEVLIRASKEISPLCFYSPNFSSMLVEMRAISRMQSVVNATPIAMYGSVSSTCDSGGGNVSDVYKSVFDSIRVAEEILSAGSDEGATGLQDSDSRARCLALESIMSELVSSDSNGSALIPVTVKAWCCVLVARVFYLTGFRTRDAFAWSRLALTLTSCPRSSSSSSGSLTTSSSSSSSSSNTNRSHAKSISNEVVAARLEALLLMSDLYEFVGDASSSLGYLGEAQALAKCYPDEAGKDGPLASLVTLHSLRIMHRIGSSRLTATLTTLLDNCVPISHRNNTLNQLCYQAAKSLQLFISEEYNRKMIDNSTKFATASTSENLNNNIIMKPMQFRYLSRVWDLTQSLSAELVFHTPMTAVTRNYLKTLRTPSTAKDTLLSGMTSAPGSLPQQSQPLIGLLSQSSDYQDSFDVNRLLRRHQAMQCMHARLAGNAHGMLPFALAAGSCGISAEGVLTSKSETTTNPHIMRSKLAINMVQDACSLLRPFGGLSTLTTALSATCSGLAASSGCHKGGAICFLVIEQVTHHLLIGRYDNSYGPLVCGIPLSQSRELQSLLREWDEVMATNKSLLQKTSSVSGDSQPLTQWSEGQKRDWWSRRKQGDGRMEELLERLQVALGLWRCLLFDSDDEALTGLEETESLFYHQIKSFTTTSTATELAPVEIAQEPLSAKPRIPLKQKGKTKTPMITVKNNSPAHAASDMLAVTQESMQAGWNWIKYLIGSLSDESNNIKHLSEVEVCAGVVTVVSTLLESTSTPNTREGCSIWKETLAKKLVESYKKRRREGGACSTGATGTSPPSIEEVTRGVQCMQLKENVAPSNIITDTLTGTLSALTLDELEAMKVTELRVRLKELGGSTLGRKQDLVARLADIYSSSTSEATLGAPPGPQTPTHRLPVATSGSASTSTTANLGSGSSDSSKGSCSRRGHMVLLLCETLQKLPWESIPLLRSRPCSRMPSLTSLLTTSLSNLSDEEISHIYSTTDSSSSGDTLATSNSPPLQTKRTSLSGSKCWYVIDPEANLPATREAMQSFLSPLVLSRSWRGFVAEIPPEEVVRDYHNSNDLFIYCGHGAGERLHNENSGSFRKCQFPAAFLWGCSSGQLLMHGVHDPTGPLLTYLQGGAPWVVGNLWDVTDKDIDRLSVRCMSQVFGQGGGDGSGSGEETGEVCLSLPASRDVCKLKYLVGCAPVVYGLPLTVTANSAIR